MIANGFKRVPTSGSWLYVVQIVTGAIKVGFATDVASRLNHLRAANPYEPRLIHAAPGDRADERRLLALLAPYCMSGEWFVDSHEAKAILDEFFAAPLRYRTNCVNSSTYHGMHKGGWTYNRREGKTVRPIPGPDEPAKVVRRTLADGTIKEYRYPVRQKVSPETLLDH